MTATFGRVLPVRDVAPAARVYYRRLNCYHGTVYTGRETWKGRGRRLHEHPEHRYAPCGCSETWYGYRLLNADETLRLLADAETAVDPPIRCDAPDCGAECSPETVAIDPFEPLAYCERCQMKREARRAA